MAEEKIPKKSEPAFVAAPAPAAGGFDDEDEAPTAKAADQPVKLSLKEREAYVLGMNKQRTTGHKDPHDPKGEAYLPARVGGYLNRHGIFFPSGYKFKGGHVSYRGHVVLVKCPVCNFRNSSDRALQGWCGNQKANEGNGCGFSAIEQLEEIKKA